ncbi:MAG: anthranilate phosphoribosyltransferase [Thermoguttaceae bacterium]|jgi:anthranilate phosphoribosyltransferase
MIRKAIKKVVGKEDLTYDEAFCVMTEIMSGRTTPTQNAAFLAALSTKSTCAETIDEITGCAAAMREFSVPLHVPYDLMEIVGTGGDHSNSFNISTTCLFVLAAGGVKVAKHGNRSASSRSGAADCLESLGINIDQGPDLCRKLLDEVGLCFMFAQNYHTSMKYVGSIRKELGIRTVFNILGPITNPARPTTELLGVYDPLLLEPLAKVLTKLGTKRGMIVHGADGFDEISVSAPTDLCEFQNGTYTHRRICPEEFGLPLAQKSEIVGGTPAENAQITLEVLSGTDRSAKRNVILLNAGAGLYIAGAADTLDTGIALAGELIDSGAALDKVEQFRKESNA